jgi:hypothetical protein
MAAKRKPATLSASALSPNIANDDRKQHRQGDEAQELPQGPHHDADGPSALIIYA